MAKKTIEKFWKIRANIDGAGYYRKIHGSNIGKIKWFDSHPQPQERNEWVYVSPDPDITSVEDSIAKADRTKVESYFSNIIDQASFGTADWNRLRKFLVDLYASHRTLTTYSTYMSDPRSLTNSDLDELFRSFGYPHSAPLRGFDENPLEQKIQFFLDLVNLYKVKGTPQSLVDVLQYYGVTELDIYEFFLKLKDQSSLFFEGKAVAGTTINPNIIQFPYANLTVNDPHWLYTEQQILQLNRNLNINLPSKSPYIGVQPIVDLEGSETSILVRKVQDQYDYYNNTGNLPPANAEITYIREVRSLLELYLSTLYVFNDLFDIGIEPSPSSDRGYLCYDGTNTTSIDIINEFNIITQAPTSRAGQKAQLEQYYDIFTRLIPTNFLVDRNSAGYWLNVIAPDIKAQLDASGDPLNVLYSLLKDLAIWVRNNIGLGFINFGFILFGIEEFFKDLKPVINFFKPYRARLLLLESLQIKNRLFNSIILEDRMSIDANLEFHDFLTGDSIPCCGEDVNIDSTSLIVCEGGKTTKCTREFIDSTAPISMTWKGLWLDGVVYAINDVIPDSNNNQYICTQSHISGVTTKPPTGISWSSYWQLLNHIVCIDTTGATYYSRETFDCGSKYDYGAVVDKEIFVEVEDIYRDHLRCPADGTAFIVSELAEGSNPEPYSQAIPDGADEVSILFPESRLNINYSIGATLRNSHSPIPSIYSFLVKDKTLNGFNIKLSNITDSDDYIIDWFIVDSTANSGIVLLNNGDTSKTVNFPQPFSGYSLSVSLVNNGDINPSIFPFTIMNQDANGFTVEFSGEIDSANYSLEWSVYDSGVYGNQTFVAGSNTITVSFSDLGFNQYPILANISVNDSSASVFSYIVTERTDSSFTVLLSSPTDSTNYSVSWIIPDPEAPAFQYDYYQSSGFRDFDQDGVFDCTHGFDLVHITVENVPLPVGYLLQENEYRILQENTFGILL